MKLVLIFILLSYAKAFATYNHLGRIVGGEDIPIETVPYQVSVQIYDEHYCGGSIISPNYVVTAAQCTDDVSVDILSIRVGTAIRQTAGQVINITEVYNHPDYDYFTTDYDIAILALAETLIFGDSIANINIPNANQTWPAGTEALITGWGTTTEQGATLARNLQGVTVELVNQDICNDVYEGKVTERMLCAGVDEGGKDSCRYDAGGALEVDGFLLGIQSWGNGCGQLGYPGVYTSVPALLDFVQNVTGLEIPNKY